MCFESGWLYVISVLISTLLILLSAFETLLLLYTIFLINVPLHIKTRGRLFVWLLDVCIFWSGITTESTICCTFVFCTVKQEGDFFQIFCLIVEIKRLWKCLDFPSVFVLCVSLTNIILSQTVFFPFGVLPVKVSKSLFKTWHTAFLLLFMTIISASSSKHTHLCTHTHKIYKMCEITGDAD